MPYNAKQVQLAQAVSHGFKPTGGAKGFTKGFAEHVLEMGEKKKKRGTVGELSALKMKR